jgi:hypothetical protein
MKKCPWCNNKAVVKNSCVGYFVECGINGHVHNIGVFKDARNFSKTEEEAINEWNVNVTKYNQK